MTAAKIRAKINRNCDPEAYASEDVAYTSCNLINASYFGTFWETVRMYHKARIQPRDGWKNVSLGQANSQQLFRNHGKSCLHIIKGKLQTEGTSAFRDKV